MAKRSNETLDLIPSLDDFAEKATRTELQKLLFEAHSLKEAEKRLKEVKARISELVLEEGLSGVRDRNLCAIVRWSAGRKSLDRELLIEHGVTPEQIMSSYKEGASFKVCELEEILDI